MIAQAQNLTRTLSETLAEHPDVEAAALYGSVARGDVEAHSDIDVLVFCRRSRKLPIHDYLSTQLRYLGNRLSLVIYSEKEMQFLSAAKSLFLLHLSREANILFDKDGYFGNLLTTFTPKHSYKEDFVKSITLVDPLRSQVFGAPNQLHRLSYIYSLFRVFGVYLLAEGGIYEFSKDRMAKQLSVDFPSLVDEIHSLSMLRPLNSNFFSGGASQVSEGAPTCQPDLASNVGAIASLIGSSIQVKQLSYREAIEEFAETPDGSHSALDYRLRMWFLLLVYDGLNLYLSARGEEELTDLKERSLAALVGPKNPRGIRDAARETIEYLRRYPMKYFLSEKSKISKENARRILLRLSNESS